MAIATSCQLAREMRNEKYKDKDKDKEKKRDLMD
jgi:hypothetical protein